jgi:xanthine dehydrogenase iron-sulfur cluster and FAD-binding subunit A
MWKKYYIPATVSETLHILSEERGKARLLAGGTDLMLELERGLRKGIETIIDISRLSELDRISLDQDDVFHIGPLVTHNNVVASKLLRQRAFPLFSAAWQVGAPQIRNRGTVAGNLVTASPANDTIAPLMALDARVTLASTRGTRRIPLQEFYTGVRRTVLQPDEMLVDIDFPALQDDQRGTFLKLGLRRAQAISLVNTAIVLTLESGKVRAASITLGAVAPTIIHAPDSEAWLAGKELSDSNINHAAELASAAASPIDDIRGSAAYRRAMVVVLVRRALSAIRDGKEQAHVPEEPVLLQSVKNRAQTIPTLGRIDSGPLTEIRTRINEKDCFFTGSFEKSLLRLLREEAGLTGTKEGCDEGECGACTVFLDGMAVMACLVPAPRANGAEIVTVEGLSAKDGQGSGREELHPVQQAFIERGAVQCGYCTPGFIMSAVKLLEERTHPGRDEIVQALTGNLCRCTGYYKIIQAIEDASNPQRITSPS